jgi:hypothetical protein
VAYVAQRARLSLSVMDCLDLIGRTAELARAFGIDFFSVLSRGSQVRPQPRAGLLLSLLLPPAAQEVATLLVPAAAAGGTRKPARLPPAE